MDRKLIKTSIKNKNNLIVSYAGKKNARYSFQLFLGSEIIDKKPFSSLSKAEFHLKKSGEYRVKIFERHNKKATQSILTDIITFEKKDNSTEDAREIFFNKTANEEEMTNKTEDIVDQKNDALDINLVNIHIENNKKLFVSYDGEAQSDAIYAFRLLLENKVIAKSRYKKISKAEFDLEVSGQYRIKIYEQTKSKGTRTLATDVKIEHVDRNLAKVRIENENKLIASYPKEEGSEYAFRLMSGREIIERRPYSVDSEAEFTLEKYGEYQVKIFKRKNKQKPQSYATDTIWGGKRSTEDLVKIYVSEDQNLTVSYESTTGAQYEFQLISDRKLIEKKPFSENSKATFNLKKYAEYQVRISEKQGDAITKVVVTKSVFAGSARSELVQTHIEEESKLIVSYHGEKDAHYAFTLLLNGQVLEKRPYSRNLKTKFTLADLGEYHVKVYEQKKGKVTQTILTDPINWGANGLIVEVLEEEREIAVKLTNVSKKFKMYKETSDKLKSLFTNSQTGYHSALKNISFEVRTGEVIGIVGVNGAGKSTLSNLLAGITTPTEGTIEINGKSLVLGVGTGMNVNLTGIENIKLKCLMMGFDEGQVKEMMPEIIEFADIGKFINQPVKTYSSGMRSRLGFGISVNVDPDILVVDEALSVGDARFTQKCLDKIREFVDNGKTVFFISHSGGQMRQFCSKAIWLHQGQMIKFGEINQVVDEYQQFLKNYENEKTKILPIVNDTQKAVEQTVKNLRESDGIKKVKKTPAKNKENQKNKPNKLRLALLAIAALLILVVSALWLWTQDDEELDLPLVNLEDAIDAKMNANETHLDQLRNELQTQIDNFIEEQRLRDEDQPAYAEVPTETESVETEPPTTAPVTDPPATAPPITDPPATAPPITDPPATAPPITDPPATAPPVTDPPATAPPVTDPPATAPPVTDPPATAPPVTDPPPTAPPPTDSPATLPPFPLEETEDGEE